MTLVELPSYRQEEARLWLCSLPNYAWQWVSCYPYQVRLQNAEDALAFKLKFGV